MRASVVYLNVFKSGSWKISIDELESGIFMICFEEYKNSKRNICTEEVVDETDLKKLRDSINYMLGEAE